MNLKIIGLVFVIALMGITQAEARGSCDGIHRCRCGSTQAAHFGLPRNFHGHNLWQAIDWVHAFPRTSLQAGVVGYQHSGGRTGHVFRVVQPLSDGKAIVADDKGTYTRNIRGATFVDPNGNKATKMAEGVTMHAKAHRHAHRAHYRVATATHTAPDRLTASH